MYEEKKKLVFFKIQNSFYPLKISGCDGVVQRCGGREVVVKKYSQGSITGFYSGAHTDRMGPCVAGKGQPGGLWLLLVQWDFLAMGHESCGRHVNL